MWDGANQWADGRCRSNRRLVFVLTCLLWFPPRREPEPGPQSVGRYPCRHRSPQIVFPWAAWAAVPLQVLPAVCGSHQWVKVLPSIPGADYNTNYITALPTVTLHKNSSRLPLIIWVWVMGAEVSLENPIPSSPCSSGRIPRHSRPDKNGILCVLGLQEQDH